MLEPAERPNHKSGKGEAENKTADHHGVEDAEAASRLDAAGAGGELTFLETLNAATVVLHFVAIITGRREDDFFTLAWHAHHRFRTEATKRPSQRAFRRPLYVEHRTNLRCPDEVFICL